MSFASEDGSMSDQPNESTYETKRKSKISYSREFLLSLSGLEICKKLPSGFDESILSEFEDAYQERQRIPGSLPTHGFRRNEYGSSPPIRGELNNYNRGVHGRWESRSSGRSDKDTDSQSDRDSDSGKRYTNPSRRGWQAPEHDGLLGSGSFPRPSGYAPGASAPKIRLNDNYQLNRTTEPYQPPRPYKAVLHPRRETTDSFNDETFGSSECMNDDKAEEERKRRASFELMRKEQHKAFQERQKMNPERRSGDFDITTLLEDSGHEKRTFIKNNEGDEQSVSQEFSSDPAKSSLPSQAPAPRPLVPPGFAGSMHERKSNVVEVKTVSDINISRASDNIIPNGPSGDQEVKQLVDIMGLTMKPHGSTDIQKTLSGKNDKNVSSVPDIPSNREIFGNDHLSNVVGPLSAGEKLEVGLEKAAENKIMGQSSDSTTVLEKIFTSALTLDVSGSSTVLEQRHDQGEESWNPPTVQSSKFTRWFFDEDKKQSGHPVPSQPNELLSLIVGGEKSASLAPDAQATDLMRPNSLFPGSQPTDTEVSMSSNTAAAATDKSNESFTNGKLEAAPAVLTCEDLENSILSGISETGPKQQQKPLQGWGINDAEVNEPRARVDNRASQHLLSLLQKGTEPGDTLSINSVNPKFSEDLSSIESETVHEPDNPKVPTNGTLPNLGKTLTLETLFGTAFMQELQSVGAPVSAQRGSGSTGSAKVEPVEPQGFPFTQIEADVFSNRNGSETGALMLNQRQQSNVGKLEKQFVVLDDLQTNIDRPQLQTEVRLPEEDSLIAASDPSNFRGFMTGRGPPTKADVLSSQNMPVHIAEKLATLNGNLKEKFVGGQGHLPFHVPLNRRELDPLQNHHLQQSSPPLRPQQFNPMGTNFHPLDSYPGHSDPQMKLMAQDFHGNIIRPPVQHPGSGFTGFDPPPSHHHHPLLQQMHMGSGFPPAHQLQGFMRGPQVPPPHANHQLPGFNHEMNSMQGLPFGAHRQPSFGGLDMPRPGPDIGAVSSHPEGLQRLIEMELRSAHAKQMHPVAAAGGGGAHISQGIYGPELDMGFGYR